MDTKTRASILKEARTWIGVSFHHKGQTRAGVDCGGFIQAVYCQFIPLKPFPDCYAQDWGVHKDNNEIYLEHISEYVTEVLLPVPAGLAVFKFGRSFCHGAICTEKGTFIHAKGRTGAGAVVETRITEFYRQGKLVPVKYFDLKTNG